MTISSNNVQDITREDIVLRRIFDDAIVQSRVVQHLNPDLFDDQVNQSVCNFIKRYFEKYKKFPTAQTLVAALPASQERTKIINLANMPIEEIDRDVAVDLITQFFVEQKTRIHLTEAAESIHNRDFTRISELIEKLQESVNFSLHLDIGLDGVEDVAEALRRLNVSMRAIPSSLSDIRAYTASEVSTGGWYRKALSVFMGMPNVGKSILLSNEAAYAYQEGYNVLYVTLELAEELIWERIAANVTDISMSQMRGSDPDYVQELMRSNKTEQADSCGNIYVKKLPTTTTVVEIDSLIQEIKRTKGVDIDLLVVDYIGIMKPAKRASSFKEQSLYTSGKEVAEQLRDLGALYEMAILTASQFGREGYENNQASMKHTAGSAGLNDTADIMVTINRDPYLKQHKMFLHSILKNRFGPNSVTFISTVNYEHMRVRVADNDQIKEFQDHMVSSEMNLSGFNDAEREGRNDASSPKDFNESSEDSSKKPKKRSAKRTKDKKDFKKSEKQIQEMPLNDGILEDETVSPNDTSSESPVIF